MPFSWHRCGHVWSGHNTQRQYSKRARSALRSEEGVAWILEGSKQMMPSSPGKSERKAKEGDQPGDWKSLCALFRDHFGASE